MLLLLVPARPPPSIRAERVRPYAPSTEAARAPPIRDLSRPAMAIRVWLPALLLAFLLAASPFTQGNMHHRVTPPVLSLSLVSRYPDPLRETPALREFRTVAALDPCAPLLLGSEMELIGLRGLLCWSRLRLAGASPGGVDRWFWRGLGGVGRM